MPSEVDEELVDFPPQEPPPAVEDESSSKKVLELIQEQCVLVAVRARCWQGRHKMDDAEIHIDGHKVDDDVVGEPYWDLIPQSWRKRLLRHGPRARRKVRSWSIPFVVKGLYFVPVGQAEQCLSDVNQVQQELANDVREFVYAYPGIVAKLKEKLKDDFKRVEKKLKKQEDLWDLFEISTIPIRVSLVEFIKGRPGTFIRQAKAAMTKTVNDLVEDMIAEPRKQVYEALQKLRVTLADPDKNVRQASLDALVRKFDKLKGFAFLADDKVVAAIQSVENQVRIADPRVLNLKGEMNETLANLVLKAEEECEEDARERRAVNQVRKRVVTLS
jgi:hypothetical protein